MDSAMWGYGVEVGTMMLFPEGAPSAEPRDVRITERAPILRAAVTPGAAEPFLRALAAGSLKAERA
jgi:hypothetical protein